MRKIAIAGGIGYVIIFITGIFANFFVLEALKVKGDSTQTFINIQENVPLFQMAIAAFILMVAFDFILTWVLYKLFKEEQNRLAKTSALLRGFNALIFGVALAYLFEVVATVQHFDASEAAIANVTSALDMFNTIWLFGLLFFGVHLVSLSMLLCKSKEGFRMIPLLLMVAGIGYLIDSCLQFFHSDYASIAEISTLVVILPGVLGELSLTVWLLFKAGKQNKLIMQMHSNNTK